MKRNSKKLVVAKETFRTLTPDQLGAVPSGAGTGSVTWGDGGGMTTLGDAGGGTGTW